MIHCAGCESRIATALGRFRVRLEKSGCRSAVRGPRVK
jgi:hypothetical protein